MKGTVDAVKRKKRRRILFALEMVVLLILVAGIFVVAQVNKKLDSIDTSSADMGKVEVNDEVKDLQNVKGEKLTGYTTIALVGLDNRDQSLDYGNSDTMIIASINNDTKKVKLVSVYRDTYLNIGKDRYDKANAAFANGGATQLMTMMNKNLDLNLDGYIAVNFKALVETIDLLGGLDIQLTEEEIVHMNSYSVETSEKTGKNYEKIKPVAGTYHLNGVQAVSYARIRYTAGNDFRRAARQRLVIYKMVEKAKNANWLTLNKIVDTVCPMISSSFGKGDMLKMGINMISYDIQEQAGFPDKHMEGENVTRAMKGKDCVLPVTLEKNVVTLHKFLYPEQDYTPSSTVKEYSEHIIEVSGYGESSIPADSEDGSLPADVYK